MKKKSKEDFILLANKTHNNFYDYSSFEYITNNTKSKIICPIHGVFEQTPVKHINSKQKCPKCSSIIVHNKQKKNKEIFINEANNIHNEKFDYSNINYINNKTKIKIICPIHGEFEQTPSNHLNGKGCLYCGGTAGLDTNSFILKANKIHNKKYDYSVTDYKSSNSLVKIICPIHGEFEQTPNNHLSKQQGCRKCLGEIVDTNSFKTICSDIHNFKYDYSLVNYAGITEKVKIICPIHGEFEQRCDSHRQGNGCIKCSNNGSSKDEKELLVFILNLGLILEPNNKTVLSGKELDIYIPSHKLAIEFNGLYWHSEEYLDNKYHLDKTIECEKLGIQLIHIFEDEWLYKKDIVKSRLKNLLGFNDIKIYGRKCLIKEVDSNETKDFLNKNHVQGNVNSPIKLGLYYENELVSLMTFGGLRKVLGNKDKDDSYELVRFCNKLNTTVIGGADKLLKYFIKTYKPKEIISYADRRWSQGNLYKKLGFTFVHNSKPNYFYIINKTRKHRFSYRKDILIKEGFDTNKSEREIMNERKIHRIYDCGNKKYQLSI